MRKILRQKSIITFLAIALILTTYQGAFACTGTIIGKDVSADGNPMIARTEDWNSAYNKMLTVVPAATHKPGEMFEDAYNFTWPWPEKTYKYVSIPDGYQDEGDVFEAGGWNEHGVTVTATVTASGNEAAEKADPLTNNGIYESSVVSVLLPQIKTAREGVELLGEIMDEKGCQEGAIVLIADQDEIWYIELLSGHQYCAVKYPDDAYSVTPNCYMLGKVDINDTENVYASENLVSLPKEHGFLVEEDGHINIKKTYAEKLRDGNRDRLWAGINFLDPTKNIPHDAEEFDLFQKTSKKISLQDVMALQRYRNEGSKLDANLPENKGKVRPIGLVEQEECHIIQIKKDYPKELGGIMWVAMGNAEHAMYVPVIGGTTETIEPYTITGNQYTPDSAYWTMRGVSALSGLDRELYGKYVREYFEQEEENMIQELKAFDKKLINASSEKAIELSTEYTVDKLQKAYDDATLIYKELNTHFFDHSGDGGYKNDDQKRTPFVPSLLGEKRLKEIYKELKLPLDGGAAQPLAKPDEIVEDKKEDENILSIKVIIDGKESELKGYNIEGSNYFKLRDIAAVLADTDSKFSINYNKEKRVIDIENGKDYKKLNTDLSTLNPKIGDKSQNNQDLIIDGKDISIMGYNIDGYNFLKLEDLSKHIKYNLELKDNVMEINTGR